MARQAKYEEEKKCLDSIRKRLNDAIAEAENMQNAASGEDLYEKKLREIQVACGEDRKEKEEVRLKDLDNDTQRKNKGE